MGYRGQTTASYAMLGDVHIAEPGALICFAGPRVIQQTIRERLPEGFQRAEYLLEHGMIDMVVHRHNLRPTLAKLCRTMAAGGAVAKINAVGERGHLNGGALDGRDIETLARGSDVIDAEPVDDGQRLEIRQPDQRDGDKKTARIPRDSLHNRSLPVAVGSGVKTPAQAKDLAAGPMPWWRARRRWRRLVTA